MRMNLIAIMCVWRILMFEHMKIRYFIGFIVVMALTMQWVVSFMDIPNDYKNILTDFGEFELVAILFFSTHFYRSKTPLHTVLSDRDVHFSFLSILGLALVFNTFALTTYWGAFVIQDSFFTLEPFVIQETIDRTWFLIASMIMSAVLRPIAEEFVFRGLLLNRLIHKTNRWIGILVSSLAFAALHMEAGKFIATFLFGIVASLLYIKTKNLFVPILLHIAHNSLIFIQTWLFPAWRETLFLSSTSDLYENFVLKATLLTSSFLVVLVFIMYLVRSMYSGKRSAELLAPAGDIH